MYVFIIYDLVHCSSFEELRGVSFAPVSSL